MAKLKIMLTFANEIKNNTFMELKFIYIGKSGNIPKDGFYALRLSKSDKKKLYPSWDEERLKTTTILYPQTHDYNDNSIFVRGIGWKKFGKTNKVYVPLFSGKIDDWDTYLNEYGKNCLFYSLSGYSLDDCDCCACNSIYEFLSLLQCKGGIKGYQQYVESIEKIQAIQTKVFNEKLGFMTGYSKSKFIHDNLIKPCYRVFLFITIPYLDTPTDDDKLEHFYRTYRNHEIKTSHKNYGTMLELEKKVKEEFNINKGIQTELYYKYKQDLDTMKMGIYNDVVNTLNEETNTDNGIFPVAMNERMKMLFGEACEKEYKYVLDNFK